MAGVRRGGDGSRLVVSFNLGPSTYVPQRRWVAGYYVTRTETVLVEPGHHEWREERVEVEPAHWETRQTPAVEEILYDSQGRPHTVVTTPGRIEKVWVPARYEIRQVKVWIPPRYETREVRVWVPGHWVTSTVCVGTSAGLRIGAAIKF